MPDEQTPTKLDWLLRDLFDCRTWEEVLKRISARAHDQAKHIRTKDQEGNDWTEAEYLDHVAEKLGSLGRYCMYRSM